MSIQTPVPHLSLETLLQLIYDDAPAAAQAHLSTCSTCQEQYETLRTACKTLLQSLFRAPCPSSEELSAAAMQDELEQQIASHIASCAECRAEWHMLTTLARLPLTLPRFATLTDALRAHMRVLRAEPMPPFSTNVALVRGAKSIAPYLFHTDVADIMIGIMPSMEMPNHYQMQGMLMNKNGQRFRNVLLYGARIPTLSSDIDEEALFAFDNLPTGVYNLLISDGETALYLPDIAIA